MTDQIICSHKHDAMYRLTHWRGVGLTSEVDLVKVEPDFDVYLYTLVRDKGHPTWKLEDYEMYFTIIKRKSGWFVYMKSIDYLNEHFPEGFPSS